jgi:hypothetical protein
MSAGKLSDVAQARVLAAFAAASQRALPDRDKSPGLESLQVRYVSNLAVA